MLMRRSCGPPKIGRALQSVCSYTQAAAARKVGIAQAKREAGYRTVGNIDGITTAGDELNRPGPLPKVKSYYAR
jgi:hypothetical protein